MRHLLRLISLRYLRAAPGRTLLTLLGILLGVSVVFAIDVVNSSVMSSFRSTIDKVAGKTALTIGAGTGVAEEMLDKVRALPGIAAAAPVIEESVRDVRSQTQLMVLGVDTVTDSQIRDYELSASDLQVKDDLAFLNDPHAVVVTTNFAKRTGVKVGDSLRLSTVEGLTDFTIRGTLAPRGPAMVFGGDLLLMDVYAAQIAFGRGKRFDHIDVVPETGTDVEELKARIERVIAGTSSVTRPQRRSQETERLMAGFRLGLSLIGLVAMFVGGFIVYNAAALAVAQRRREIGIWRALGATRTQLLLVLLGEAMAMALAGGLGGLAFGVVLARAVLNAASSAISAIYITIKPEQINVSLRDAIHAIGLGMFAALIAAFFPARRAAFVEPASIMRQHTGGSDAAFASGRTSLVVSFVALLSAAGMAVVAHWRQDHLLGYAVSGICALAIGFVSPVLTINIGKLARRIAGRASPAVLLGITGFMRNAGRNSVAIAAFGIGLANVVNTDAFVGSMKYSTARWFDRAARADLIVFIAPNVQANIDHAMPESLGTDITRMRGVEFVDPFRMTNQTIDGRPYKLASHDFDRYRRYNDVPIVAGDAQRAWHAIDAGDGIAASEAFVREFHKGVGDKVTLQTALGPRTFEIALVYVDYTADIGILSTSREVYKRLWKDSLVDSYNLYLHKGTNSDDVRAQIKTELSARHQLLVLSNEQYRAGFVKFIDGSFALMRATEIVAIVVAVLGIINSLLVSIMDRRTEIGLLTAIGTSRQQIRHMLIAEGVLIGIAAAIIGVSFGALFSAYIVRELLRFQVGWQMTWKLSGWVVLETFVLAQIVSVLAVWWPSRSAQRITAAEALQYE